MLFAVLACLALQWCSGVRALPTWEGLNAHSSFTTSLVPSVTFMPPELPIANTKKKTDASLRPGEPGNLTAVPAVQRRAPPLFSVSQDQLWQYRNESTIYPVAVKNTTLIEGVPPLQLVVGKQPAATVVAGGSWRWRGSMLRYDLGVAGNSGVFYLCPLKDSTTGIFMFLEPSPTPAGCHIVTLHSFSARIQNAG
ncbi:hypothetical protein C8R47DRAFT_980592 [Mycena vitilis]|nr:hypothetical protein C8R47DRAFT_980592 [Mycena vitilis]